MDRVQARLPWRRWTEPWPALLWAPALLVPVGCRSHVASHTALDSCLFDASNHEQDGGQEGHTALCDSKCVALCDVCLVNLLCSQSVFPHVWRAISLSPVTTLLKNQQFTRIISLPVKSSFTIIFPFYFLFECLHLWKSPSSCIRVWMHVFKPHFLRQTAMATLQERASRLGVCTKPWPGALGFSPLPWWSGVHLCLTTGWLADLLSIAASRSR